MSTAPYRQHADLLSADQAAGIRETHSAVVLLLGDRAYKVKKPVDLGFLDFRSLEARRLVTARELELNRRLAPDVYLDVATVTGSDGRPCEYVLVMRRMPEAARLSTLVREGGQVEEQVRRLARLVSAFHAGADRGPAIAAEGGPVGLRRRWAANLRETEGFRGGLIDAGDHAELAEVVRHYIDGRAAFLQERAEAGCAVDGHGDLIADDVFCLPDGPRVLDCLEFDDRLRWVDVLDDVGFMAMDLERLGRPDLSDLFLGWYAEFSGTTPVRSLQHHYVSYRAFVRAKVACIRAAQGDRASVSDVRVYVDLALAHARASEVMLVLVGGAPGSGKTTLARAIADRIGGVLLSSDRVRRELPGLAPEARYTVEGKAAAYAEMLRRAGPALEHGETVILDATWGDATTRAAAARLAAATSSRLVALECAVPVDLAVARAGQRQATGIDLSDAGVDVARRLAGSRDPWPDATTIDTAETPEQAVSAADAVLRRRPS